MNGVTDLEKAKAAKQEYMRKYRQKNRERLNQQHRDWSRKHPEAVKQYQHRYWLKKHQEQLQTGD